MFDLTAPNTIPEFRDEYRFLSNPFSSAIIYRGVVWDSVEYLFQALKTEDEGQREVIRHAVNWREAKELGQSVKLRPGWDEEIKFLAMEMCLRLKFHPNSRLYKPLCETHPLTLIEGNRWKDAIWGVRIDTGRGENHLGRLLMKLRNEFCEVY